MVALLRRVFHRPAPHGIVWPVPEDGPPFDLPPGMESTGDPGLDALLAIAHAAGATITKIAAPEPLPEQLGLFDDCA